MDFLREVDPFSAGSGIIPGSFQHSLDRADPTFLPSKLGISALGVGKMGKTPHFCTEQRMTQFKGFQGKRDPGRVTSQL